MKNVLWFLAGLGIGSVITWKITENYYRQIANEEIESVVNRFKELEDRFKKDDEEIENIDIDEDEDKDKNEYNEIVRNYKPNNKYEEAKLREDEKDLVGPYVISPEEFGENDYEIKSLTLYSDGTLVDNEDHTVAVPEHVLGEKALDHIGEYEDDAVHVRDDMNQIDYEVIKVDKTFKEAYYEEE